MGHETKMASESPCGFSLEKNDSQKAPDNDWYSSSDYDDWIHFDESSWDDKGCNPDELTTREGDVSEISSSERQTLRENDISWHDGLISEIAEDHKDKFLQPFQAIVDSGLVKDSKVSPILQSVRRDHPAWDEGHNCENAQDNTERFRSFCLNNQYAQLTKLTQRECGVGTWTYATTTKRWLGVSRQDPRLRLAKYRELLIGQAQEAGHDIHTDFHLESTYRLPLGETSLPTVRPNRPTTTGTEMVENLGKSSRKRRRSSPSPPPDMSTCAKRACVRTSFAIKRFAQKCVNAEDDLQ